MEAAAAVAGARVVVAVDRVLVDVGAVAVAGARGRGRTGEIVTRKHLAPKQAH
jgi:hypothetical protein